MGRHRKTMPTFTERLFWGQGDASDLRVFDTDIGRLGGLICGEHLMTLVRAAMIGLGEEIHVAVFPGAFALHTGPQLEEWDAGHQAFWGHASVRAHALEAGAFVLSACGQISEADIPDDFPYKGRMNIGYAKGGSSVIAPLGIPAGGAGRRPGDRAGGTSGLDDQGLEGHHRHQWALRATRPSQIDRGEPRALTTSGDPAHTAQTSSAGRSSREKRC